MQTHSTNTSPDELYYCVYWGKASTDVMKFKTTGEDTEDVFVARFHDDMEAAEYVAWKNRHEMHRLQ